MSVGLIWPRWFSSGAPWAASGSFGSGRLIRARPVGRRVHWGVLVSSCTPWVSSGSFRHVGFVVGAPSGSLSSFIFVGLIRALPGSWGARLIRVR